MIDQILKALIVFCDFNPLFLILTTYQDSDLINGKTVLFECNYICNLRPQNSN